MTKQVSTDNTVYYGLCCMYIVSQRKVRHHTLIHNFIKYSPKICNLQVFHGKTVVWNGWGKIEIIFLWPHSLYDHINNCQKLLWPDNSCFNYHCRCIDIFSETQCRITMPITIIWQNILQQQNALHMRTQTDFNCTKTYTCDLHSHIRANISKTWWKNKPAFLQQLKLTAVLPPLVSTM